MNASERNHYLPQFYLEAFGTGNEPPVFWVHDKRTLQQRQQSPINTGVERNLYSLERADGSIDDSIEREVFAKLDGFSVEAVRRLSGSDARLEDRDIAEVSGFVAFMATRVPRSIQTIQEVASARGAFIALKLSRKPDEIKEMVSELQAQGKLNKDSSAEQVRGILSETDESFEVRADPKAAMTMSISMTEEIHQQLLRMNWCLYGAPSGIEFITADAPLVCCVLEPDGQAIFGGGYARPNAQVTLPLSPDRCLYLDRKHNQRFVAVSENVVKEINRRTAWAAERFIISRHRSEYVGELVKWASKSLENPRIDRGELYREFDKKDLLDWCHPANCQPVGDQR